MLFVLCQLSEEKIKNELEKKGLNKSSCRKDLCVHIFPQATIPHFKFSQLLAFCGRFG
jgi:hypothetical protein